MIYSLKGTLVHRTPEFVVVECGGVGYKCTTSLLSIRNLPEIGNQVKLYTYMAVKENDIELFGFASEEECKCFKMLIGVSGVGSKAGTAILSEYTPEQVVGCIASGNAKALTKAAGVGKKLADRIVLELKDKVKKMGVTSIDMNISGGSSAVGLSNIQNALEALAVLGYDSSEVMPIISNFDGSLSVENLIRMTLVEIGKNKK